MIDLKTLIKQNRLGQRQGLPSFCTANEQVIRSILRYSAERQLPTLIEATCNQVNQQGGYTGMNPMDFIAWVRQLAAEEQLGEERIIFGGDHLGPNPWRKQTAAVAMDKARELVKHYVEAGFTKIHLDASMACADDGLLSFEEIAERAALLCKVAERYAPAPERLVYVIGTEVPIPGGETEEPDTLDVTSVERFKRTIDTHHDAFVTQGLDAAWERIVGVVTQPGVDFGHSSVFEFKPEAAQTLSNAILEQDGLCFEAHSTDYQPTSALGALVDQHFFFLKVGPELTFRMREGVYALANIEDCLAPAKPSHIREVLAKVMRDDDVHWRDYYSGTQEQVDLFKIYSYSDRIRYYWSDQSVQRALDQLLANLCAQDIPEAYISQYFMGLEFGEMPATASALLDQHIQKVIFRYYWAAGFIGE